MFPFLQDSLPSDIQRVLDSAAMLDVTEFKLFHMAFADWHGYEADSDEIEPFFVKYMFEDVVPYWVRQYTRKVLRLAHEGQLSRRTLGLQPVPTSARMRSRGGWFLIILVLCVTFLIILAVATGRLLPFLRDCYFPPCY